MKGIIDRISFWLGGDTPKPKPNSEPLIKKVKPLTCEHNGCNTNLTALSYRCFYCSKFHCDIHRLPEDHDCEYLKVQLRSRGTRWLDPKFG